MEDHFRAILKALGEDPNREGLLKTPQRAAEAFTYLTRGYHEDLKKVVNGAIFDSESDEMIIVKDIELYSICEHHMLPFFGKCFIGYIPQGKIIGLSKIARVVDVFAHRLQIQERMTKEIGQTLMQFTNAQGVGVVIEAKHLCMMMRGVEKQNSVMTTSYMAGLFRSDPRTRSEFLTLIKQS